MQEHAEHFPDLWQVGSVIHDLWEVVAILGEGGMGRVYLVDGGVELMTMKCLRPTLFPRREQKDAFLREAALWTKLEKHPNLLECFFVVELEGIPCIFAEYIDGGSFAQSIRERRLYQGDQSEVLARILDIAIQFAWGLSAAHNQGLVHQDVKPSNVLLNRQGEVKVGDFGLTKALSVLGEAQGQVTPADPKSAVTFAGMTPAYCSPEQATRQRLTPKTDIWSWAVSVLEMFSGEVSWMLGALAGEALEHSADEQEQQWQVRMPEAVRSVLRNCLQQQPEARPASMAEVARTLEAISPQIVGQAYPWSVPSAPPKTAQELASDFALQGGSLIQIGKYEEALVALEQAIQLGSKRAETYADKGVAFAELGRYEEALAACDQACLLAPSNARMQMNKAELLAWFGRYEEALATYEQAIQWGSRDTQRLFFDKGKSLAQTYAGKGKALGRLGRYEEALASLEQAITLDPGNTHLHQLKKELLARLRR